ncbi:flavin-dependent oxidoreductase [Methylobacterium indicum]|uniref:Salicylate 1-monooxygenase n=1 Tax=Methylobacterium indicum TaxID=1775910 RepID=A0ABR5HDS3_9HYPH|nr:flavin-dependent oxidoreductase [Methylobacterium indicum]KMO24112.1 salicylate 1-monooxygenase [Methylobacterium indicum]KMO24540.1 salicylate 1-monooxygenase [Methylobacterium indicum]
MRVLIVGAGIGGLATALMLHRRGIRATIVEQASEVREVGVGINTLPHAIRELAELDLLPALDRVAIRTKELAYFNRQGQEVWREPRGLEAGHPVPQFSIHRGRLQAVLYDAVRERLGPDAVQTGLALSGFMQDEGGVTAHFTDALKGDAGRTLRGDVLIACDGIHSVVRKKFFPDEGPPRWDGVLMWRGATEWAPWGDGRTMAIGGGMGAKCVLYPIAEAGDGRQLMNWVVFVKMADGKVSPPPKESWSRPAHRSQVLPYARRFALPGFDLAALVEATPQIFEYPMCDRDPLPRWTHGRVTLLGDAAHPMYPVGSNGASQAILDARALGDALARSEHPMQALSSYEAERRPKTAEIVMLNRKGGPERVIDEVEKRAPAGFTRIEDVLGHAERQAIVGGYAGKAGFAVAGNVSPLRVAV